MRRSSAADVAALLFAVARYKSAMDQLPAVEVQTSQVAGPEPQPAAADPQLGAKEMGSSGQEVVADVKPPSSWVQAAINRIRGGQAWL